MSELHIDFETKSVINLALAGVHKYAAHPSTDILCVGYAVDDGPVEIWIPGAPCPKPIARAVAKGWLVYAHNATFERLLWNVLHRRHGWPQPRLEQFRCTMAMALASALPGSLEGAAAALSLELRKDPEGHAAMLRLSRPRKPRKGEDAGAVYWGGRDGDLDLACRYCRGDVEQERAICRRLPPLSADEQALWFLDALINDRGFGVDVELAAAARAIVQIEQNGIDAAVAALTGGTITSANQVGKITEFVRAHGHRTQEPAQALGRCRPGVWQQRSRLPAIDAASRRGPRLGTQARRPVCPRRRRRSHSRFDAVPRRGDRALGRTWISAA